MPEIVTNPSAASVRSMGDGGVFLSNRTPSELEADLSPDEEFPDPERVTKKPLGEWNRYDWMMFILNPSNIPTVILLTFVCTGAGMLFYWEMEHLFMKFSLFAAVGCLAVLASGGTTYYVYQTVDLQHQIAEFRNENKKIRREHAKMRQNNDQFEQENGKLASEGERLEASAKDLEEQNHKLAEQLDSFKDLKNSMNEYAKDMDQNFQDVLKNAMSVYKEMDDLALRNTRVILLKELEDIEFLDHQVGMSEKEYDRFVKRIPESLQEKFSAKAGEKNFENRLTKDSFKEMSKGQKTVDTDEIRRRIDAVLPPVASKKKAAKK